MQAFEQQKQTQKEEDEVIMGGPAQESIHEEPSQTFVTGTVQNQPLKEESIHEETQPVAEHKDASMKAEEEIAEEVGAGKEPSKAESVHEKIEDKAEEVEDESQ